MNLAKLGHHEGDGDFHPPDDIIRQLRQDNERLKNELTELREFSRRPNNFVAIPCDGLKALQEDHRRLSAVVSAVIDMQDDAEEKIEAGQDNSCEDISYYEGTVDACKAVRRKLGLL